MRKIGGKWWAVASLFLFALTSWAGSQNPAPAGASPAENSAQASGQSEPGPDHGSAYYHFMLARRLQELAGIYNRGDYVDQATAEYKRAMEADPDSLFLRVNLAELYSRAGRVGDAVREAEAVLKVNPDQADAHRLLANLYLHNLGDSQPDKVAKESLQKAIEHFEALVKLEPTEVDSYIVLGRLYKLENQNEKAEEAFKKALGTDPSSKSAVNYLAQLYFDRGEYGQAVDLLKKVPENEMDAATLSMLGLAYLQSHNFGQAVSAYEKALTLEPENHDARRYYADALIDSGRTQEAREQLKRILKADPEDGSSYLRLAQLDRQEGRFDQAREELQRAKTLLPDNPEVPYQQALLEEAFGNDSKAVDLLQGLIKQFERPAGQYTVAEARDRAIFLERLGLIYRTQEKIGQALDTFKQIVALGKNQEPQGEALIIDTLRLNRQADKALEEANAAVRKFPKERSLILVRASLLGERGQVQEAVQPLQALLDGTPTDREIYLSIAQIYSQAKQFPEAEESVRQALALSPREEDQVYPLFVLGSIYERQKKYEVAEEQFKKVLSADPFNAAAANYLGYLLADRGVRLEESVKYIQKALQVEPNNGAYLDSLGWAYYKMNRFDLAQPPLEKAARLISNDPTILEHLGNLYLQLGKKRLAQEQWERALKVWPGAVSSDFDAEQAARLQKQLDELKLQLASEKSDKIRN